MNIIETVGVVVFEESKVLLVRHTAQATQPTDSVGLPAGTVKEGETHIEAAIRELFEETGLITLQNNLVPLPTVYQATLDTKKGVRNFELTAYLCTAYSGKLRDSDETIPFWTPLSSVDLLETLGNVPEAISEAKKVSNGLQ